MPEQTIDPGDRDISRVWTAQLLGHDYELQVDASFKGNRIRLRSDGVDVHDRITHGDSPTISLQDGQKLKIRLSPLGAVKRATIRDGDLDLDFDAPPGTRAARVQAWGRRHPHLYAIRHVLTSGVGVLLALVGVGWLIRLIEPYLPDITLPSIPWPDVPDIPWPDLPSIPWPDLPDLPDLPDFTAPGWVVVVMETQKYWFPLLVAVGIGVWEVRRQRRQRTHRERLAQAGTSHESSPQPPSLTDDPSAEVPRDST